MAEKHKFDKQIIDAVNALFAKSSTGAVSNGDPVLTRLEEAAQELLKQEWEKSKREAATGP